MNICKAKGCTRAAEGNAKYCSFHRSVFGRAKQKKIQKSVWKKARQGERTV